MTGRRIFLISNDSAYIHMFRSEFIAALVAKGLAVTVLAPPSERVEQLRDLGADFIALPISRGGMNPAQEYRSYRFILARLREHRPDIVLNYSIKLVIYGSLAARKAGVPAIYSMITGLGYVFTHHTFKHKLLQFYAVFQYRRALAGNRRVFFLNEDDARIFRERACVRPEQVHLIAGEGVNLKRFDPARFPPDRATAARRKRGEVAFLLIARLLKDKGIGEYIEAARRLREPYPTARFHLLGAPHENPRSYGTADIEAWRAEGVIEYLGVARDVRPVLAAADVYVLPSYREGLSISILEAMAMGLPIVAADVPGCRETVESGANGFLVPPRDAAELALALEKFIVKPKLIEKMGSRSRSLARSRFDVTKINRELLKTLL